MGTTISNVDPSGNAREIADTGQIVEAGASVEVDADLAAALLEQSGVWAKSTTKAAKAAKEGD